MGQYKVTIYAAGPTERLAEALGELAGGATVIPTTGYWDSGGGILMEPASKIETILGIERVIPALEVIDGWLGESDQSAVLIEIAPTFAQSLYRID